MTLYRVVGLTLMAYLLVCSAPTSAQFEKNYTPREVYTSANSDHLVESIREQAKEELKRVRYGMRDRVSDIYKARTKFLIETVRRGGILKDDSLQALVDGIMNRLLARNSFTRPPKKLLILKNSTVNAVCYGEGTFGITIGFLSKARTTDELAFTIAHEFAHYELDHVAKRILAQLESNYYKKLREGLSTLVSDKVTLGDVEKLKDLVYDGTKHSRANELQADSLGYHFLINAGYSGQSPTDVMNILDSAVYLKHALDEHLFEPFYSTKYPFQEIWLKKRPSIYSKKPTSVFIFSMDSIGTHPDINLRRNALQVLNSSGMEFEEQRKLPQHQSIIHDFERVESAYFNKNTDITLALALELLNRYPRNAYLISVCSKVFIDVLEHPGSLPDYTIHYGDQFRLVNNFLHNLESSEMGEVAFHFLNNQTHFDKTLEEHYYLLWKICSLTDRNQVKEKIKKSYKDLFPDGKYKALMKEGITLNEALSILSKAFLN